MSLELEARDCTLIVGKRGSGKSEFAKRELLAAMPRVVAYDPKSEYAGPGAADGPDGMRELVPMSLDDFCALILTDSDEPAERGPLAVAVQGYGHTREERASDFADFTAAMECCRDVHLMVDEVGILPPEAHAHLEYLASLSRGWGMPLTLIAQRATQIPRTAREQASRVVSFRQNNLKDAAALDELMGPRAQRILTLPRYAHVDWYDEESPTPEAAPAAPPARRGRPARTTPRPARKHKGTRK